jgi:hypothetical protein
MTEHTSTNKQQSVPITNGTASHQPRRPDQPASGSGATSLAVAIDRLASYLEVRDRAERGRDDQRRAAVDVASVRDWLDRYEAGLPGETPRGKPIARREEQSGGQTESRDSKANGSKGTQWIARPVQPAKVFSNGDVTTKVWANHDAAGHLTWSIQQFRVYRTPKGYLEARSFRFDDLHDAMRGAYEAERWIRKNERRYRLLGWFLGY